MPDDRLLTQARDAGARLLEAERAVLLARADYHTAIRRLHLAGTPLRDLAQSLSLSHQRVQQIVNAAGGSWWQIWKRRRLPPDAVCSWCQRPPAEVAKLIAGPRVFICDDCVAKTERQASKPSATTRAALRCAFCRRKAGPDRTVVAGPPHVCSGCLTSCREILNSRGTAI